MDMADQLKRAPIFWSQLGWGYDPPRMDPDGRQIMFFSDSTEIQRYHRDFYARGFKIHSSILFSGWCDTHKIDFTETDRTLDELFACGGKDLLYIPRIKLNVPLNWGRENPEEMCVYYPEIKDPELIRSMVNAPQHDIMGWNSPAGHSRKTYQDDRPNMNGRIGNQSFSSPKWLHDASCVLERLLEHIEHSPYGSQIAGYHISYGMCGETSIWGVWNPHDRYADYGIGHKKRFFAWGLDKYGSLEKLRTAWQQPEATEDTLQLPSPAQREYVWHSMNDFFRNSVNDRIVIDYEHFFTDVNVNAIEHFAKLIKKKTSGKPVGIFYGYYLDVPRVGCTGHTGFERVLNSPYVDFLASPKSYRRTVAGEPGGEHVPSQSVNRKKIYINELDNRTHLSGGGDAVTMDETRTLLWREFAKNKMRGSGYWWMDLGGGWFDSVEVMNELEKLRLLGKALDENQAQQLSDVLIVSDESSFHVVRPHSDLHNDLLVDSIAEILLCGCLVDHYRFADLRELDLSRYRCVFFLNTFNIDRAKWELILPKFRPDACLVWHYAPGVFAGDLNFAGVAEICGIAVNAESVTASQLQLIPTGDLCNCPETTRDFTGSSPYPCFSIRASEDITILGHLANGLPAIARTRHRNRNNILTTVPFLKKEHYRKILESAGVKFFAPTGATVYGDSRFIGIFSQGPLTFAPSFSAKHEMIHDLPASSAKINMHAKDARFYCIDNCYCPKSGEAQ